MQRSRIKRRIVGLPRSLIEVNGSLQYLASLRELGWHQSLRRRTSLDAEGGPLPWYTYPCVEWLSMRLRAGDTVFEFGAGSSTLWYAARVRRVISVEHDPIWYTRLIGSLPANVEVQHCPPSSSDSEEFPSKMGLSTYVHSIEPYPLDFFDVVVVDGMERLASTFVAIPHLKEDGLLILDNSDRPAYRPAIEHLASKGFGQIDFCGFAPGSGIPGCTSVFARTWNRWTTARTSIRTWGL